MQTPLENFIDYKANTGMQCGNYSIDVPKPQEGEQYRFHFDATACVGCRCCEVACNEQNNNPADVKWRRVGEMEGGEFPAFLQLFNSMSCNHCIDPECLKGCPTESYIKIDETGIVIHDDDACIGCQYCTWNCPYGVPTYHEERHIVTKCHMCHERLEVGETPACIQACPAGAIEIEVVNVQEWIENDMQKNANMPFLPDATITNSTTRYTLPENIPDNIKEMDEHLLKPAHAEIPLVFMTVLTQISLGGFAALFFGDFLSFFGFETTNWIMALLVLLPGAIGLPLSALHLGRPYLAITAMKNIKTSWLSREALALGIFIGLATMVMLSYLLELPHFLRFLLETITLSIGIYGIYAQAMIYRIKARPSWDRLTTTLKFFGTSYIGFYLIAFIASFYNYHEAVSTLLLVGIVGSVMQFFFSYEDYRTLATQTENSYQLLRTKRLYDEQFTKILKFRFLSLVIAAILLPLLATLFSDFSSIILSIVLIGVILSELSDRFLFYSTVVSLGMAGGFFVGKQRG